MRGESAWKFAITYSMVKQAPTGMSYVKWIMRYKTENSRREFLREMETTRFGMDDEMRSFVAKNSVLED